MTVEQHEFIQDVYLDGQGNVPQREIERAMGAQWVLQRFRG
jgi:hypothetical protein